MTAQTVYVIDADSEARVQISRYGKQAGFDVYCFASAEAFWDSPATKAGCVVIDLNTMEDSGTSFLAKIDRECLPLTVMATAKSAKISTVVKCMKAGAVEYIEKPVSALQLVRGIQHTVHVLTRRFLRLSQCRSARELIAGLTERELEVFSQITRGRSNKEVAKHLGISPRTIEIYRAKIMRKMQCESLSCLVEKAARAGIQIEEQMID